MSDNYVAVLTVPEEPEIPSEWRQNPREAQAYINGYCDGRDAGSEEAFKDGYNDGYQKGLEYALVSLEECINDLREEE